MGQKKTEIKLNAYVMLMIGIVSAAYTFFRYGHAIYIAYSGSQFLHEFFWFINLVLGLFTILALFLIKNNRINIENEVETVRDELGDKISQSIKETVMSITEVIKENSKKADEMHARIDDKFSDIKDKLIDIAAK